MGAVELAFEAQVRPQGVLRFQQRFLDRRPRWPLQRAEMIFDLGFGAQASVHVITPVLRRSTISCVRDFTVPSGISKVKAISW